MNNITTEEKNSEITSDSNDYESIFDLCNVKNLKVGEYYCFHKNVHYSFSLKLEDFSKLIQINNNEIIFDDLLGYTISLPYESIKANRFMKASNYQKKALDEGVIFVEN